jgi:L-ascorbate metabolism protein UlaG (beta-lactamase superfamily)
MQPAEDQTMKHIASALAALIFLAPATSAHPPETASAEAQYLANEAILVTAGETRILFDPLFSISYGYPLVADDVRARMMAGQAPFDGVDVVFVSHVHGDHFDAEDVNDYLAAHPDVTLVAPHRALLDMRGAAGWDAAFEARIRDMPFISEPQTLVLPADGNPDAIRIEAVHIPHAGGPGRAGIQNMAYRVTLNDIATVMHLGDATPEPAIYETHRSHFDARRTATAFPPYWILLTHGGETTGEWLNSDKTIGIHVPINVPGELERSGEDFLSVPGEVRVIELGEHAHD